MAQTSAPATKLSPAPAAASPPSAPIIVIAGQTASGKSALAMRAARQFGAEIICADSRTIYKDMDIGTAKPSAQDRRLVPHHGLDLIEPDKYFSAAAFKDYASLKVNEIQARGRLPIIVGGTGLYIDGYVYDFNFAGQADALTRAGMEAMDLAELQDAARALGIDEFYIDFKNQRHLSRAVERAKTAREHGRAAPARHPKPKNILLLGLQVEREQLLERIAARVDTMFDAGFVDEVQNVVDTYGVDATGLLTPGYKAARKYLAGEISLKEAKELFVRGDKQLAKRQQIWFKRNPDIIWVQSEDEAIENIFKFTQV